MISGNLTKDSELRSIFPNGSIPLTSPQSYRVRLGAGTETEEAYFLAVKRCTPEQVEAMARRMEQMKQGTFAEAMTFLASVHEVPIRAAHITGAFMELRSFI